MIYRNPMSDLKRENGDFLSSILRNDPDNPAPPNRRMYRSDLRGRRRLASVPFRIHKLIINISSPYLDHRLSPRH